MKKEKMSVWRKFMLFYESYKGQRIIGCFYSLGASVVIIGALFKILHLPGAGPMLFIGMMTEAVIFAIGCLEKPQRNYGWNGGMPGAVVSGGAVNTAAADASAVSAQNADAAHNAAMSAAPAGGGSGMSIPAGATIVVGGSVTTGAPAAASASASAVAAGPVSLSGASTPIGTLSEENVETLKKQIEALSKTAGHLCELDKVAIAASKLGGNAEAAATAAGEYAEVITAAEADARDYARYLSEMAKKTAEINAIYDQQLALGRSLAKSYVELEAAQAKLAKQIAELNNVYGNMLTSIS